LRSELRKFPPVQRGAPGVSRASRRFNKDHL
jgi:hypothetical protein